MRTSAYCRLIVVCCLLSVSFAKRHELTRNGRQVVQSIPTQPPPKEDGPTPPPPVGLLLLPFPQTGSLVDVPPGAIEAIQGGSSPYANLPPMRDSVITPMRDPAVKPMRDPAAGPPNAAWTVPPSVNLLSQIVNQSNLSGVVPGSVVGQLGFFTVAPRPSTSGSVANDQIITTPSSPLVPNLVQAVLGNGVGLSSNVQALTALLNQRPLTTTTTTTTTTTPSSSPSGTTEGQIANDPFPNPLAGAFGSSQAAITNATNVVQGVAGLWTNNLVSGIETLRPSNDEMASSTQTTTAATTTTTKATTTTSATTTTTATRPTLPFTLPALPVTFTVPSIGGAWNNLASAAQSVANQFGSNIPGSSGNLFDFSVMRPSDDETVSDTRSGSNQEPSSDEANTSAPDTPSVRSSLPAPSCASCGPGQDVCATSPLLRIIGGATVSDDSKYPWLALITYLDSPTGHGSLVNDRVIVTTATIVDSMPTTMHIRANFRLLAYDATDDKRYSRTIASTVRHPSYSPRNMYEYNIGLLVLEDPLTSFVPVCLPPLAVFTPIPQEATMIGWGPIFSEGATNKMVLQEVSVKMSEVTVCKATYPQFSTHNQCGGALKSTNQTIGTCTGDGGEPLVVQKSASVELLAVAIDVPEVRCAEEYQPSIFTNVASFTDWIVANGPGCKCGPSAEAPSLK